ncbi:Cyclin-T1-5 [Citrus sinensis]|nr:Cyclin-T1-5 [Citrus sinensis]
MAGLLPGESSHHGTSDSGPSSRNSQEKPEEVARWYFSRREIEDSSPSRRDGIDLKKETYLRKSYCTFLQDLGMRLKVTISSMELDYQRSPSLLRLLLLKQVGRPQVTIATAIIFCHRFFIRQSHSKNDRRTIATVCMFLAGKVEETPRPLKDVIIVSYEIIHKKDSTAPQRIRQQKEVYEQQKELILLGERVVLATLGFDLNVHHPYKPLVEAIKKFKVAQNALAQVAWNFVNDGLRTSLCLQFKPHHIAAGAIFLAAKFLKVKLPSDGDKVWWQEFDVTPRQLEEVSNQMLELYEQNRVPQSQGSEVEGSAGGASSHRPQKTPAAAEEQASKQTSSRSATEHSHPENNGASSRTAQNNQSNDDGSGEMGSVITDHKADAETKDNQHHEQLSQKENVREVPNKSKSASERIAEDQGRAGGRHNNAEAGEWRDDGASHKSSAIGGRNLDIREGPVGQSPKDAIKMIDEDKVKAIREKRRKSRGEPTRKKDFMDEDDLIERELEDIEIPVDDEKMKREQRQSWSKSHENSDHGKGHGEVGDGNHLGTKGHSSRGLEAENAEEGEMVDGSPMLNSRKRKAGSPVDRQSEGKKQHDYMSSYNHDNIEDGHKMSRPSYSDREYRRHAQENHL